MFKYKLHQDPIIYQVGFEVKSVGGNIPETKRIVRWHYLIERNKPTKGIFGVENKRKLEFHEVALHWSTVSGKVFIFHDGIPVHASGFDSTQRQRLKGKIEYTFTSRYDETLTIICYAAQPLTKPSSCWKQFELYFGDMKTNDGLTFSSLLQVPESWKKIPIRKAMKSTESPT